MKKSKCIKCGNQYTGNFCPDCGTSNPIPTDTQKKKRNPFKVVLIIAAVLIVIAVIGGGKDSSTPASTTQPDISSSSSQPKITKTYQSVLDEYSKKIVDAVPGLVEEYNQEAATNTAGLEGLAELSNNKIMKLAEISNEGIEEMAELMYTTGSGKYEEYEEWAGKLMDVYTEEATKITDAYMKSAMG